MSTTMKDVTDVLSGVRETIGQAEEAYANVCQAFGPRNSHYRDEQEGIAKYFLDRAFLELRLFLEAKGLVQMLRVVTADHTRAKRDLMKGEMASYGEPYSFWAEHLRKYVKAVATTFEQGSLSIVTNTAVQVGGLTARLSAYSVGSARG